MRLQKRMLTPNILQLNHPAFRRRGSGKQFREADRNPQHQRIQLVHPERVSAGHYERPWMYHCRCCCSSYQQT
jgi:hypothetical protein